MSKQTQSIQFSLRDLNRALDLRNMKNSLNININKWGKREVTLNIRNAEGGVSTLKYSFVHLYALISQNLLNLQPPEIAPFKKVSFLKRFSLVNKSNQNAYKQDIDLFKNTFEKINKLKDESDKMMKQKSLFTRIFAAIRNFFGGFKKFPKFANRVLVLREKQISENKKELAPFSKYHIISQFSKFAFYTYFSVFSVLFMKNSFPSDKEYFFKTINNATSTAKQIFGYHKSAYQYLANTFQKA